MPPSHLSPVSLAVAAGTVLAAWLLPVAAAGAGTPYIGIGAKAASLNRSGVMGARAGYENDTFLSDEAPMLVSWPEAVTERDFFHPKRVLPQLAGTSYRAIWGRTTGIVLGIRLIGIQSKPAQGGLRVFVPADTKLVHQRSRGAKCTGWVFTSASLRGLVAKLQGLTPPPAAVYIHAWWTAPRGGFEGNEYLALSTSNKPSC